MRGRAALFLACGFFAIAAADQALAWGAAGGGGGKKPDKETKVDPEKMRKLRDLTKRLQAELKFDNQKSPDVQLKELQQAHEIVGLMEGIPVNDSTAADLSAATLAASDPILSSFAH
jgi:hypothetical protein